MYIYCSPLNSVQKDDIGAHINVGRTYNNLKLYKEAEDAYLKVSRVFLIIVVKRWFIKGKSFIFTSNPDQASDYMHVSS